MGRDYTIFFEKRILELEQERDALKTALAEIGNFAKAHHLDQERDSHIWLHALIVDIPSMVEAALNAVGASGNTQNTMGSSEKAQ